jgi:beta-lactam-binding protein with PASTA domain
VTGRTTKSALDTLSKAGLTAAIRNPSAAAEDSQESEVIAQNPAAGSSVGLGTAVDLTIRAIDSVEMRETKARPRLAASEALIFLALVAGALLALRMFVF